MSFQKNGRLHNIRQVQIGFFQDGLNVHQDLPGGFPDVVNHFTGCRINRQLSGNINHVIGFHGANKGLIRGIYSMK